jgi:hypothetical protein
MKDQPGTTGGSTANPTAVPDTGTATQKAMKDQPGTAGGTTTNPTAKPEDSNVTTKAMKDQPARSKSLSRKQRSRRCTPRRRLLRVWVTHGRIADVLRGALRRANALSGSGRLGDRMNRRACETFPASLPKWRHLRRKETT